METVLGQPSWFLQSDRVRAHVTELGGMIGPAEFQIEGDRWVSALHVAPWAEEDVAGHPAILQALRGDFFCMPFGGFPSEFQGEVYPLHGEPANQRWTREAQEAGSLVACLNTHIRPGRIVKEIELRPGQSAIYSSHTLVGYTGPMTYGHHQMPRYPSAPESGLVSVSPFLVGQVYDGAFEDPAQGGYTSLQPGAFFDDLRAVPNQSGGVTDLTRFPARAGFEDLVTVYSAPGLSLGWSAVVFPREGYAWFSLRNPATLSGTVIWISNGGRHYAPWSGRHRCLMALEDVLTSVPPGIGPSVAPNPFSSQAIPTHVELSPDTPHRIPSIMAVTAVPIGYGRIARIEPESQSVVLIDEAGTQVRVNVEPGFLAS